MITTACCLAISIQAVLALDQEPLCLSRYDYDYKVLRNIVSLEQKLEEIQKTVVSQTDIISKQEQQIEQLETTQKDIVRQLETRPKATALVAGSSYVRWGRSTCPQNGTETVYSGYAAGSHYTHTGAAANTLCLPSDPLWGEYNDATNGYAYIYGAEYQISGGYSNRFFKKDLYENDVPCAVCRSVRTTMLMIPGRNACYDGWTEEYDGYLAAGHYGHTAATEYVCLDADPEMVAGGQVGKDERLFYMTDARCGSLPCPPYVEGRELTCVVCTL